MPETCCKKRQDDSYINLDECQLSNDGPPGKVVGKENVALHYWVSSYRDEQLY